MPFTNYTVDSDLPSFLTLANGNSPIGDGTTPNGGYNTITSDSAGPGMGGITLALGEFYRQGPGLTPDSYSLVNGSLGTNSHLLVVDYTAQDGNQSTANGSIQNSATHASTNFADVLGFSSPTSLMQYLQTGGVITDAVQEKSAGGATDLDFSWTLKVNTSTPSGFSWTPNGPTDDNFGQHHGQELANSWNDAFGTTDRGCRDETITLTASHPGVTTVGVQENIHYVDHLAM